MRAFIIANVAKPVVQAALDQWLPELQRRCEVVGVETDELYDLKKVSADVILVFGGDGTLLTAARRLVGKPIPMMGVNFGRLGFLASFQPDEFLHNFDAFLQGKLRTTNRMMLETSVVPAGRDCSPLDRAAVEKCRTFVATALNDAVITAGPPFHMIELQISADVETAIRYFGDGAIVATPSGSTAYNVSAGGPIINPDVEALCITPICPHSLSFRPVVVSSNSTVLIVATKVNEGTTLFCDGQASTKLCAGDRIVISRSPHDAILIENPQAREWRSLAEKLHWAATPTYNSHNTISGQSA